MTTYLIGCDLQPGRGYTALEGAIGRLGDARKCLESTWLVSTERNASAIREYLSDYLADGDKVIVVECGRVASWAGFDAEFTEWFGTRI